jgi:hypothetical protein
MYAAGEAINLATIDPAELEGKAHTASGVYRNRSRNVGVLGALGLGLGRKQITWTTDNDQHMTWQRSNC